jgi:hypothetical protein
LLKLESKDGNTNIKLGNKMNHERLVKAMHKAGLKVNNIPHSKTGFYVETAMRIVSWWKQDDSAICVKSRRPNDEDDCQSDYSAGYFCRTIKSAVASLGV